MAPDCKWCGPPALAATPGALAIELGVVSAPPPPPPAQVQEVALDHLGGVVILLVDGSPTPVPIPVGLTDATQLFHASGGVLPPAELCCVVSAAPLRLSCLLPDLLRLGYNTTCVADNCRD